MLTTYLNLIKEQRANYPTFPKDYRVDPLPRLITTSTAAIQSLISWPTARFTNIIERSVPLYRDTEDVYYYEFVDIQAANTSTFPDWKFFYIPVSKYDDLIAAALPGILPTYKTYNVETASVDTVVTLNQPLVAYTRPNNTFFNVPVKNQLHPLLPHFAFTGYSFLDKKGSMIYEYADYKMFHDDITVTYYSILRPTNFFFPSSDVVEYALVQSDFINFRGDPPSFLEIYNNEYTLLEATGYTTTADFSSQRRWYEYDVIINDEIDNTVLLPYAPTKLSTDFIEVQLNAGEMGVVFNPTFSTQTIGYNQVSSNNKIQLL